MAFISSNLKILVVSPAPAQHFVMADMRILNKRFQVSLLQGLRNGNLKKLFFCVKKSDFVLCWFGCRMAAFSVFLSKLLRKKVAVIAGGQDVVYVPEMDYGLMGKRSHRGFIRFAFNNCDSVIAVSKFSARELLRWTKPKALCLIYNGVEIPQDVPPAESREGVLCVARLNADTIRIKGIQSLLLAAKLLPQVPFTLVGEISGQVYRSVASIIPGNVRFTGSLDHKSVTRLCAVNKVYIQPSYYESFGVALAEAMANGCVPVVTRRGALPEVVGDAGLYVSYGDERALAQAIEMAFKSNLGIQARNRVSNLFTLERRETLLKSLIDSLIYHNMVPHDMVLEIDVAAHKS